MNFLPSRCRLSITIIVHASRLHYEYWNQEENPDINQYTSPTSPALPSDLQVLTLPKCPNYERRSANINRLNEGRDLLQAMHACMHAAHGHSLYSFLFFSLTQMTY